MSDGGAHGRVGRPARCVLHLVSPGVAGGCPRPAVVFFLFTPLSFSLIHTRTWIRSSTRSLQRCGRVYRTPGSSGGSGDEEAPGASGRDINNVKSKNKQREFSFHVKLAGAGVYFSWRPLMPPKILDAAAAAQLGAGERISCCAQGMEEVCAQGRSV